MQGPRTLILYPIGACYLQPFAANVRHWPKAEVQVINYRTTAPDPKQPVMNRSQMNFSAHIDGEAIVDWTSFHDEFQRQMGFFDSYGRNMNAWIDCMTDMYTNGEYKSLTKFDLQEGDRFLLVIDSAAKWKTNAPEVFSDFEEFSEICNKDTVHFEVRLQDD